MRTGLLAGVAAAVLLAGSASATDFSFTGSFNDPNDVQFFNFTVGGTSNVTLRSYSYAGGTNAAGQTIAGGNFDPILALFSVDGMGQRTFIDQNDDGGCSNVPVDPNTGSCYDTFLQASLSAGSYAVSVMAFSNFFDTNTGDFQGTGSFNGRGQNWAFDVLNVDSAVQAGVPEPATWAMMLTGFFGAGAFLRRRRAALA